MNTMMGVVLTGAKNNRLKELSSERSIPRSCSLNTELLTLPDNIVNSE